ncbi:MAG TPA: 23S rRNA (uracil(1939)-C(5))-methyltransferase RlmD [Coleofasciculaceae cyanobacterium]|jgi:23S rRNA (uracil1939-C5)-methyltransferase
MQKKKSRPQAKPRTQNQAPLPAVEINIDKLVYGGDGLGRLGSGEIIFVPWSAPGDRLKVQPLAGSQKPARGRIAEILETGPERTTPPCSVFGTCGGCQWQHLNPSAQRMWKRDIVAESLQRIGKLPDVQVLDTIGSDEATWHYRNRVQWDVGPRGQLGYCQASSHDVVAFDHCWIIPEPLNRIADWLQEKFQSDTALATRVKRIEAFVNRKEQVLVTLEPIQDQELNRLAAALKSAFPEIIGIVSMAEGRPEPKVLQGQAFLTETLGGHTFCISAGSFFQTNLEAAERMLAVMDEWLLPDSGSLVDLYAGVGVFAIHFSDRFKRVLAVESAKTALNDARQNIILVPAPHVAVKSGDVSRVLGNLSESFDVAIVDPPRAGCRPEVLDWLNRQVQRQILYVSCNPTTLARDLKTLAEGGWQVQAVQPIDMFPQTYHMETIVNLTR